jgi:hypothetical protein
MRLSTKSNKCRRLNTYTILLFGKIRGLKSYRKGLLPLNYSGKIEDSSGEAAERGTMSA